MDIYITSDLGPSGERDTYKVFADKQTCYQWLTDNHYMYRDGDESHWFHKDIETMDRYGGIPQSLVVDVFPAETAGDDSGKQTDHRDQSEDYPEQE